MKTFFWLLGLYILSAASSAQSEAAIDLQDLPFEARFYEGSRPQQYGIIVLGGSSGGKPNDFAKKVSELGFSALALAYFDRSGASKIVPQTLELIPLEYFEPAKQWVMKHPSTRNGGVILVGQSKGAELSLLLAAHDNEYKGVVAIAPSHVAWQGNPLDFSKLMSAPSSWSTNGQEIPFVPYVSNDEKIRLGFDNRHKASLTQKSAVNQAKIPLSNIENPLLLLSGQLDASWPASEMAAEICDSIKQINKTTCTHINYEDGDHLLTNHEQAMLEQIKHFLDRLSEN